MAKTLDLKFKPERETKRTIRFQEQETAHIGTLYVQKSAIEQLDGYKDADHLIVTLKAE